MKKLGFILLFSIMSTGAFGSDIKCRGKCPNWGEYTWISCAKDHYQEIFGFNVKRERVTQFYLGGYTIKPSYSDLIVFTDHLHWYNGFYHLNRSNLVLRKGEIYLKCRIVTFSEAIDPVITKRDFARRKNKI